MTHNLSKASLITASFQYLEAQSMTGQGKDKEDDDGQECPRDGNEQKHPEDGNKGEGLYPVN